MAEKDRPLDGSRWGAWVRGGHDRWEVVRRSWLVFVRNTTELVDLLNIPASNPVVSMQLIGDDREATASYWEQLDQRLHNQLASAVSLVDHTRRLLRYFEDVPALGKEYAARNERVTQMAETVFLRDLRNYLLHYGAPPIVQTVTLGGLSDSGTGHVLKLSASKLLEWSKWGAPAKDYLASFPQRDGPILGRDVVAYGNAMSELFGWLFKQRVPSLNDPGAMDRFRIDPPAN